MSPGPAREAGARAATRGLALLALALCSGCGPAPGQSQSQDAPQGQALQRAVEAPQQRARAVEADVLEARRRTDAAVEAQSD